MRKSKCAEYTDREMFFGLLLLPVFKFVSGFIRAAFRFIGIDGPSKESASASSKGALPLSGYQLLDVRPSVSAFLKSCCCGAPVADENSLSGFQEDRIYIICTNCHMVIDYANGEGKWLLDQLTDDEFSILMDEFSITQSRVNIDPDAFKLHPRGTIEERNAFWNSTKYQIMLHERIAMDAIRPIDLRRINPF